MRRGQTRQATGVRFCVFFSLWVLKTSIINGIITWNIMEYYGILSNIMEYYRILWNIMEYNGISSDISLVEVSIVICEAAILRSMDNFFEENVAPGQKASRHIGRC